MPKHNYLAYKLRVNGQEYPLVVVGQGVPCILLGSATLTLRSLSKRFFDKFEVYSSDLYWMESHGLPDVTAVNMDKILDDIKSLIQELGLKKCLLLGHSVFGLVAIEFAKKYPELLYGIIMIGTPVNSNSQVAAQNEAIFQAKANARRKMIDAKARAEFAKMQLPALGAGKNFMQEYVQKCSPRYWHVPDFDCSFLWKGLVPDRIFDKFFWEILPSIDCRIGLEKIQTPIFLAAGMSDYDCWPIAWQDLPNLPSNMYIARFDESGHWPQFEEPDLFDELAGAWSDSIV